MAEVVTLVHHNSLKQISPTRMHAGMQAHSLTYTTAVGATLCLPTQHRARQGQPYSVAIRTLRAQVGAKQQVYD